ncbi:uncharacterized protein LOC8285020 [Ricinus communis]|uniref:DUF7787 domain-containing protein n=1 Tax=Ricinus communis TaxID=3988 RepID=B9RWB7_RICCO|nr:uncharacterized protein LOC8285020 [Ricinus communis]EEF44554.1 hypothetical protein RCOM_1177160 [Ricinus communis]|eukprot:XP_002518036.1 uncharacterized protein LOC8285020 [Ricinus communis]
MKSKMTQKIALEAYLEFLNSQKQINFTSKFLNEIISMHGFKKIQKSTKEVLKEAVDTIELVNLSRSTLSEDEVSSCAFMNLEEVIAALNDLNWQDCCITSIQTQTDPGGFNSKSAADGLGLDVAAGSITDKRGKRKRSNTPAAEFGGSSSC